MNFFSQLVCLPPDANNHLHGLKPFGMNRNRWIVLFCLFSFGAAAQNTLLIENFDYPAGAPLRDHGWHAHSAASTNPILVSANGLSLGSTAYFGNGIGQAALVTNTGSDENRPLSAFRDTASVYASFLVKTTGAVTADGSGYFFHFAQYSDTASPVFTAISTAHRARTYITTGSTPASFRLGLTFNSATVPSAPGIDVTNDLDTSKTYLVVVKYTFVAGADNDQVSLFVFQDGDSIRTEPVTPTLGPFGGTAADAAIIQGVALRQYNAAQRVMVDGIIVRDGWLMQPASTTGYNELFAQQTSIYPNPMSSGPLFIALPNNTKAGVQLLDLQGKKLWQGITADNGSVDLPTLPAGLYLLQIEQAGKIAHKRLVVR
jgi:hypothetical protein